MLAAGLPDDQLAILVGVLLLVILGAWLLVRLAKWGNRAWLTQLNRAYEGIDVQREPWPGAVFLRYHTYHGFIVWCSQAAHEVWTPPDDARLLLGRLFKFNCAWSWMAFLGLAAFPLSIINYALQRASLTRQIRELQNPEL